MWKVNNRHWTRKNVMSKRGCRIAKLLYGGFCVNVRGSVLNLNGAKVLNYYSSVTSLSRPTISQINYVLWILTERGLPPMITHIRTRMERKSLNTFWAWGTIKNLLSQPKCNYDVIYFLHSKLFTQKTQAIYCSAYQNKLAWTQNRESVKSAII